MARVFKRIINLLLFPAKEWKAIADENDSRKTIYVRFLVPLLCIMTVTTVAGALLFPSHGIYFAICRIFVLWSSLSVGLYISSFLITEIMAREVETREYNRGFALMAYSLGAACLVIIIVALFPFFREFIVLAFYSCYLYWLGIPHLIQADGKKRTIYGMTSFVIMALTYLLTFFLFGNIFEAILI